MAKISIVDNDQDNVATITRMLKANGHVLSVFNTSATFMTSLRKKQPDMIIIGVELQGEDGRELSKQLHLDSSYKNIPVMLTSPFYHTDSEIRSFYCDQLVSLPFEMDEFNASVEGLLAHETAKA